MRRPVRFMDWPIGPYGTAMFALLALTIPVQRFLSRDEPHMRVALKDLPREIREKGYWWHIGLYVAMFLFKAWIDHHNEPMKARVGGYTHWIHDIEGAWTATVQEVFLNDLLTDILSGHYLFMYLFMIWFSPMYYILTRDEIMADKAALNYFVIYLLSVPLYLFMNVEVTSSFLPGVDALLYHDSFTLEFFTANDPMDNSIPSLHIGLPISLLILNRLHCRSEGISIKDWRHREFDLFVMANVAIYAFSIQYLGIHWAVDILPGLMMAVICAAFCHAVQPVVRARGENGWTSLLPDKRQTTVALVSMLLFSGCLVVGAVDGPGADEDLPNYRFGHGDVNLDTVEVHSLWDPVYVDVVNVGEWTVEVLLIKLDEVEPHADRGNLEWDAFSHAGDVRVLEAGEAAEFEVLTESLRDISFVLMRLSPDDPATPTDGVGELRITPHYVDDELIWSAVLSSWPAFIIFGISAEGLVFREVKENGINGSMSEEIVSQNSSNEEA